jgi:hypothetical protein
MLSWCERKEVGYIIGLAKNARLDKDAGMWMAWAEAAYRHSGEKQRLFVELSYGARTWTKRRRVIARLEHGAKGANPRYVVTNLERDGKKLYEQLYCQRGEMENRIKEQELDLFADRTSCHNWWPNQFRLIASSLAYRFFTDDYVIAHGQGNFLDFVVEIVRKMEGKEGFEVMPRRWVVECTFGWMTRSKRLAHNYESRIDISEAMVHVTTGNLFLRRIAHQNFSNGLRN